MALDFEGRKTLLYADLFKPKAGEPVLTQDWSTSSNSDSLETSDDDDFIAELSRQMAECMLQEEEEEMNNSVSRPVWDADRNRNSCLRMKNGVAVRKEAPVSRTELTQFQKTEQNYGRYRGGRNGHVGSGMRAVFLGSKNGSSAGTGVFLPPAANCSVQLKKKSGLSTVLIPTRVLEALELHYNRLSHSAALQSPLHASSTPTVADEWSKSNRRPNFQIGAANRDQILPQEWTY